MPGILRRVVIGRVNDPLDSTAPKVLTQCPSRYGHSADNGGPPETRTQLRFLAKDSRVPMPAAHCTQIDAARRPAGHRLGLLGPRPAVSEERFGDQDRARTGVTRFADARICQLSHLIEFKADLTTPAPKQYPLARWEEDRNPSG